MPRIAQNRRAFALHDLKTLDDAQGTFSGYLATFDNVDLTDDVIEQGSFAKTLNDARERKALHNGAYLFPVLYQHDERQPCGGFVEAHEDSQGLYVKGQLDLDTQLGRETYSGLKKGYLGSMSIGYSAVKHKWVGNIRHLQEIALYEGSIVTFPANPEATVNAVKADDAPVETPPVLEKPVIPATPEKPVRKAYDFNTAFQSLAQSDQLQDDWGDTWQAMVTAANSVMWQAYSQTIYPFDGMETIDPVEAMQSNLDAFSAAVIDLVKRSVAANFAPCLDDDGDSFYDPDGPNASDDGDSYGMMSASIAADVKAFRQRKAGRTVSAANHAMMTKALDMIGQGHKALTEFVKANDPASNPGDEPPTQSDSVYDPGFGKSANASLYHYARNPNTARTRAGARPTRPDATTAKAAGARDVATPQATTHTDSTTSTDDDVAQFRALMADMRSGVKERSAVAG